MARAEPIVLPSMTVRRYIALLCLYARAEAVLESGGVAQYEALAQATRSAREALSGHRTAQSAPEAVPGQSETSGAPVEGLARVAPGALAREGSADAGL